MFEIKNKSSKCRARTGVIHTDHGDIQTPVFMPVGTQATVKSLDWHDLRGAGADAGTRAEIILGNTYHLHLRPGEDLIAELGGLHKFMNWDAPILTDSGGFQVFSLGAKIDNAGVDFRSHIDGSKHRFSPEVAIDIQKKLGADIIMVFDECTPDKADRIYAREALDRTHDWAKQSLNFFGKIPQRFDHRQFLFGIIQGGRHDDLRIESAKFICDLDFDGIAIGGESIGYNMEVTRSVLESLGEYLPEEKPRYTMGVGFSPENLFDVVERGIDMFDCVAPTRLARTGALYSRDARLNICNARFAKDLEPIDSWCDCFTCKNHSRAYLHHLFSAKELTAYRLATIHNVHFMLKLMSEMREAIDADRFLEFRGKFLK